MPRLQHLTIEEGRDLLRVILEQDMAQGDLTTDPLTSDRDFVAFSNLQAEILPEHFHALHVVPFVNGWHWRLELRGLPLGYPIGVRNLPKVPLRTERQAMQVARSVTIRLFRMARGNALTRGTVSDQRYFDLFGVPVPVPSDMLENQPAPDTPSPATDSQIAGARADIQELLPEGQDAFSRDTWGGLARDLQRSIQQRLAALMARGRFGLVDTDAPRRRH